MSDSSDAVRDPEHADNGERAESSEPLLWHYTSLENLLKILNGSPPVLHATSMGYLNDSREFRFTADTFRQIIEEQRALENDPRGIYFYDHLLSLLDRTPTSFPFVFSLSHRADDLSQWRAYGDGGSGCAIGFSVQELERHFPPDERLGLQVCEYADATGGDLRSFVETLRSNFDRQLVYARWRDDPKASAAADIGYQLTEMLRYWPTRMKGHGYRDEAEARIVVGEGTGIEGPFFRATQTTLVPYMKVPLPNSWDDPSKPLLCEVMLGPTTNPELALAALRQLLDARGLNHVRASQSTISYRVLPAR